MSDIYKILKDLGITYEKYDHPPVYTVEEAEQYDRGIDAAKSKNLFLRNKKGTKHFLVVAQSTKRVDLKKLASQVDEKDLSFASPERLIKYLRLTPGSVSPFGLIHDESKSVYVVVDNDLLKSGKQGFHPNINTATLVVTTDDFKKYLAWTTNPITYISL